MRECMVCFPIPYRYDLTTLLSRIFVISLRVSWPDLIVDAYSTCSDDFRLKLYCCDAKCSNCYEWIGVSCLFLLVVRTYVVWSHLFEGGYFACLAISITRKYTNLSSQLVVLVYFSNIDCIILRSYVPNRPRRILCDCWIRDEKFTFLFTLKRLSLDILFPL